MKNNNFTIDSDTQVLGIIGNPVRHSLSPIMHNAAFAHLGLNAVYVAFPVTDVEKAIYGIRALDIKGLSITIPHKTAVIPYLDWIDPMSEKMDAVNTIVNHNGKLKGYNTDGIGAYNSVIQTGFDFENKNVLIIGNGGTAKAIAYTILSNAKPKKLSILGRNKSRIDSFIHRLQDKLNFNDIRAIIDTEKSKLAESAEESHIIINTSPIGMSPDDHGIPIPSDLLSNKHIVFDVVYKPLKTKLLKEAEKKNAQTINGLEMLVNQGMAQFELWTDKKAPKDIMLSAIKDTLDL